MSMTGIILSFGDSVISNKRFTSYIYIQPIPRKEMLFPIDAE